MCVKKRPSASCVGKLLPHEGRAGSQGLSHSLPLSIICPLSSGQEHLYWSERIVFLEYDLPTANHSQVESQASLDAALSHVS